MNLLFSVKRFDNTTNINFFDICNLLITVLIFGIYIIIRKKAVRKVKLLFCKVIKMSLLALKYRYDECSNCNFLQYSLGNIIRPAFYIFIFVNLNDVQLREFEKCIEFNIKMYSLTTQTFEYLGY